MKKYLLFAIVLFAAVLLSCSDDTTAETKLTQGTDRIEALVEGGDYQIAYSLSNPASGTAISAKTMADWIGNFDFSQQGVIGFKVSPNNTGEERTGAIEVRYGALGFEVPVTQGALDNPEGYNAPPTARVCTPATPTFPTKRSIPTTCASAIP